jgi:chromosome segregation ATPase
MTAAFAALQLVEEASRRLTERVAAQEGPTRETREIVDRLQGRSEELQSEIRREAEQVSSSIGSLRSELEGFAQRLSHTETMVEQQRAAVSRLEASERRRGESLQEMARLMGSVQQALQPAESHHDGGGQ